ncbi:hypothetical protein Slin15195_G126690 [Septoria linicola]|uniref:Uncharacterized protein n=1 Tax=Septoria linicola TaxID=215465 RepID=A0A9Q9B6V9_9PEZI|nr:hypothetical protein Slin15195_G126690 [Septoria linicola]
MTTTCRAGLDTAPPLDALRRKVFEEITSRLRRANVNVSSLSLSDLEFCLPRDSSQHKTWRRLPHFPMLTTDITMASILNLRPSTKSIPGPDRGQQIFYLRSFRVTIATLHKEWQKQLELIEDDETEVYVRYVGTFTPVSACARFVANLKGRTDGIYAFLIATLSKIGPAAIEYCSYYTFPGGTSNSFRTSTGVLRPLDSTHTNIKEQALIELFDFETLLDRQPGGIYSSYVPKADDQPLFRQLGTNAFGKLTAVTQSPAFRKASNAERLQINCWMRGCRLVRTVR